jgi:hypothetical protein
MLGLRRSSTWDELSVTSIPVGATHEERLVAFLGGTWAEVGVAASGDQDGRPIANVIAMMQRTRRAEHEELWAQLFLDDGFVDVVRALEVEASPDDVSFMARFRVPDLFLDGETHRARVRFVTAVSRVIRRSSAPSEPTEAPPAAVVEADFVATRQISRVRLVR